MKKVNTSGKQKLANFFYNFWLELRYFYTKGAQKQITIIWKQLFFFQDARHIVMGFSVLFFVSFRVIGWKGWLITKKNTTLPATIVSFQKLPYENFLKQDWLELDSTPIQNESIFITPVLKFEQIKWKNTPTLKTTVLNDVVKNQQIHFKNICKLKTSVFQDDSVQHLNNHFMSKELVGNKLVIQNRFSPNTVLSHGSHIKLANSCNQKLHEMETRQSIVLGLGGEGARGLLPLASPNRPFSGIQSWLRNWYKESKNYPKQFKINETNINVDFFGKYKNKQNTHMFYIFDHIKHLNVYKITNYRKIYNLLLHKNLLDQTRDKSNVQSNTFLINSKLPNIINLLNQTNYKSHYFESLDLYKFPYLKPKQLKELQYQKYYQYLANLKDWKVFLYNVSSARSNYKLTKNNFKPNLDKKGIIYSWPRQIMESTSSVAVEFIANLHLIPSYMRPRIVPEVPEESKFNFIFHQNIKWPQNLKISCHKNEIIEGSNNSGFNNPSLLYELTLPTSFKFLSKYSYTKETSKNKIEQHIVNKEDNHSHELRKKPKLIDNLSTKNRDTTTGNKSLICSQNASINTKLYNDIVYVLKNKKNANLGNIDYIKRVNKSSICRARGLSPLALAKTKSTTKSLEQQLLMDWKNAMVTSALVAEKRNYAGLNFNNFLVNFGSEAGSTYKSKNNWQQKYVSADNPQLQFLNKKLNNNNNIYNKPIKKPIKLRTSFTYKTTNHSLEKVITPHIFKIKPVSFTRSEREQINIFKFSTSSKCLNILVGGETTNSLVSFSTKNDRVGRGEGGKAPSPLALNNTNDLFITLKNLQTLWTNPKIKAVQTAKQYLASLYVAGGETPPASISKAQQLFFADGNVFQKPSIRSLKAKNVDSPLKGQLRNKLLRFRRFNVWQRQIQRFQYGPYIFYKTLVKNIKPLARGLGGLTPNPLAAKEHDMSNNTIQNSFQSEYDQNQGADKKSVVLTKNSSTDLTLPSVFSPSYKPEICWRRRTQDKQGIRRLNRPINIVPSIETKRLLFFPSPKIREDVFNSIKNFSSEGLEASPTTLNSEEFFITSEGLGGFAPSAKQPPKPNFNQNQSTNIPTYRIKTHIPILIENHTKQVQKLLVEESFFEEASIRLQNRLKHQTQAGPKLLSMQNQTLGATNRRFVDKLPNILFNSKTTEKYVLSKSQLANRVKNVVLKKALNLSQSIPPEIKITLINQHKKIEWPRTYLDYDSFYRYLTTSFSFRNQVSLNKSSNNFSDLQFHHNRKQKLQYFNNLITKLPINYNLSIYENVDNKNPIYATPPIGFDIYNNHFKYSVEKSVNYNFIPWTQNYDDLEQVINKNRIKLQYFRKSRLYYFETRTLFQSFMRFWLGHQQFVDNKLLLIKNGQKSLNHFVKEENGARGLGGSEATPSPLATNILLKIKLIQSKVTSLPIFNNLDLFSTIKLPKNKYFSRSTTTNQICKLQTTQQITNHISIGYQNNSRITKLIESTPTFKMSLFNFSGIAFIMFIALMLKQLYVYYGEELINLSKSLDIEYMASALPQILGQEEKDLSEVQMVSPKILSKHKQSFVGVENNNLFLRDVLGLESSLPVLGEIVWFFKNNSVQNNVPYSLYNIRTLWDFICTPFITFGNKVHILGVGGFVNRGLINSIVPKAVLLTGPPGIGKTYLSRALAAEAGVPIISRSGGDFTKSLTTTGDMEMSIQHEKESKDAVNELFIKAREIAPCLVFIDEIDAIAQSRNQLFYDVNIGFKDFMRGVRMDKKTYINTPDKEVKRKFAQAAPNSFLDQQRLLFLEQTNPILPKERELERWEPNPLDTLISRESEFLAKNYRRNVRVQGRLDYAAAKDFQAYGMLIEFLIELDNLRKTDGIVILGATNRLSALDAAFIRSGRFDGLVNIELPGKLQRIQLLQKLMYNNLSSDSTLATNISDLKQDLTHKKGFVAAAKSSICTAEFSWDYIGNRTEGLSGAEITTMINQSIIESVILNTQTHTIETLEKAIDRLISLNEDTTIQPKKDWTDPWIVVRQAFYQAAKAILYTLLPEHPPAVYLPLWPRKPNQRAASTANQVRFKIPEFSSGIFYTKRELEIRLIGLYAGKAGELMLIYQNALRLLGGCKEAKPPNWGLGGTNRRFVDEATPSNKSSIWLGGEATSPPHPNQIKDLLTPSQIVASDSILWQSGIGQNDLETAKDLLIYMVDETFLYSQQFASLKFNPLEITQLNYKLGGTNLIRNTVTSEQLITNIATPAKMVQTPIIRRLNMTSPPKLMLLQLYDWELIGTKNALWYRFWTRDRRERAKLNVQWVKPEKFFHANIPSKSNIKNWEKYYLKSTNFSDMKNPYLKSKKYNLSVKKVNSKGEGVNNLLITNCNEGATNLRFDEGASPPNPNPNPKTNYPNKFNQFPNRKLSYNNRYHNIRGRLFNILSLKGFNAAYLILDRHREILDYFAIHLLRRSVLRQSDIRSIFQQFGYSIESSAFGYTLESEM